VIGTARAPSEFRIDFELTTNWKSLLETDLLGALDFDTTINLTFLSNKDFGADCKLDFDNGKLTFCLMKVTISRRLNASFASKIMVFEDEESTKSYCGFLRYVCFDPPIN